MDAQQIFSHATLCCILLVAVYFDIRTLKIPNQLILVGLVLGFFTATLNGATIFGMRLLSGLFAFCIGFFLWRAGVFRAGDAKLIWVMGLYTFPKILLIYLTATILVGGIFSMAILLHKKMLMKRVRRVAIYFQNMLRTMQWTPYPFLKDDPCAFPFSVSVFVGVGCANIALWLT